MVKIGLWILLATSLLVCALPRSRYCGRDLSDILSVVCEGRGYNKALAPYHGGYLRRVKRGVVDECCKQDCTRATLETYCSPRQEDFQIEKRSEREKILRPLYIRSKSYDENRGRASDEVRHRRHRTFGHSSVENRHVNSHHGPHYTYFGSGSSEEQVASNKVKRNDKGKKGANSYEDLSFRDQSNEAVNPEEYMAEVLWTEEVFPSPPDSVPIRHHKGRWFTSSEKNHSGFNRRKISLKEGKKETDRSATSQIGSITPYYHGQTLINTAHVRKTFHFHH